MSDLASDIMENLAIPAEVLKGVEAVSADTPAAIVPAVTPPQGTAPAPVAPTATPVTAEPPKQDGHTVPLPTFLDMRDQNKALKARLAELEKQPAPQVPSVTTDPEAYARYTADLVNNTRTNTVFDMSELIATKEYGAEPVKAAMEWAMGQAQASPSFAAEYLKQKHPIDWAVKQQKRDALLSQIGDDPDEFVRKRYAELNPTGDAPTPTQPSPAAAPQPAAPVPAQPTPTRSLASAPTAGSASSVPAHPVAAIDAVFQ